mgnify:CR=1 FL=1
MKSPLVIDASPLELSNKKNILQSPYFPLLFEFLALILVIATIFYFEVSLAVLLGSASSLLLPLSPALLALSLLLMLSYSSTSIARLPCQNLTQD